MSVQSPVPADHPMMIAWKAYEASEGYANTKRWATDPKHTDGSLWAAFVEGWNRRAPVAPAEPVAWRLIDSAPQDGTVVDLWREGERLVGYWWSQTRKTWITHQGFPVVTVCLTQAPTHWMLPPAAPGAADTTPAQPSTVTAEAALSDLIHEVADVLNPLARLIADKGEGIMAKFSLIEDLRKALKNAQAASAQLKATPPAPSPVTGAMVIDDAMIERARIALHALRYERLKRMFDGDKRALGERSPGDPPDMQEDAIVALTAALAAQKAEG